MVKSSKDLRVAFLRQEFVDELVMERSLKEELTSVFTDEAKILGALQACEVSGTTSHRVTYFRRISVFRSLERKRFCDCSALELYLLFTI